jgi:tubulin polyglutamylase TTLL9
VAWVHARLDSLRLSDRQRVNHFRNHFELTRKDNLVKNVKRTRRALERSDAAAEAARFDFLPPSFVLPGEYGLFLEEFRRVPGLTWIMKPTGRSQGKGIFLFSSLSEIAAWRKAADWSPDAPQAEAYVAQRYIANPYTIGGKKFDLRLYALVTSFSPLTVWLYRSGFGRFTFTRYRGDARATQRDLFMHLTNVAIQKTADDYDARQGCKFDLRALKLFLVRPAHAHTRTHVSTHCITV